MPLISRTVIEALAIASLFAIVDLFIAFIFFLFNPTILVLASAASYLILEFGVLLILGSCMMSRSPLDEEKRYDESGNPVSSWKWAQRGKMILLSSFFMLLLGIVLAVLGGLI